MLLRQTLTVANKLIFYSEIYNRKKKKKKEKKKEEEISLGLWAGSKGINGMSIFLIKLI